ncbi:carbamoyl-phosphate synthase large subunit [Clostridium sp. OM02-18AC]|uniref:carbamoyl-phosphate synthase large subunit n=1 Tax=Clostridium sp. OM02-18AC TaxID=2292311 RepID=UPI000E5174C2|nr:carbamoyl-phosphate synthase large subunit [Clostridium sp. OM02-18AC]RHV68379.1 carbamoyl-phosphate synthase large subunit [Clostridium sp. OM02-18AC]
MPKNPEIKKVLVLGSGPIVIGQAAEFDYAGTQACRSLKEEGIEVVLLNSNPATIMTDKDIADRVYIEPLTVEVVEQLIKKEKPDSVLPTLGGQAGLNLAMELEEAGFLKENNVRLIGTTALTIKKAEDREMFKETMEKIGEPVAPSDIVENVEDGLRIADKIGYPIVLRPAYTLGGSGGGIAENPEQCREILENGLRLSRVGQVLVERCIAGWKEIEYEVMRDSAGNVITVCNMENLDPVGVHTGDSIVVAPSQTLGDKEYQMLRTSALNIISELGITGGCNVQYALHPTSFEYCVIEVNPRVSRSSALASKATGYPIAKVAAKIALGYTLDEIKNAVTRKTYASFEPMLDYCVVKMPRLPFDKFISAKRTLGTQMKATGEVMSICTNFEGALMKAIRSLEQHVDCLLSYDFSELDHDALLEQLHVVDDRRIWVIAEALRRGISYEEIHAITKIDLWFIDKLAILVEMEDQLKKGPLTPELLKEAKRIEFPDNVISRLTGVSQDEIKAMRHANNIRAAYKMVDTCAAEFAAETPYYYSCFDGISEVEEEHKKKKVLVLGSGPIRIGQGIEFDFCSVHSTWAFEKEGYETIIVNNNPETVSTDFDIADKLYFEPLTPEDVESIVDIEKPDGAVVQFGGQTAIKLTESLMKMGVPILGTAAEDVDAAEDRELFDEILEQCQIPRPAGHTVFTAEEAKKAANDLGYPVLVRPSYVLGGQGMQICINDNDIDEFIGIINQIAQDHPILVDKYIVGKEIEVDAVCDGKDILIPGIMEHIERTGVHSGDSISVYPAPSITPEIEAKLVDYTEKLARALHVRGMINIQFIVSDGEVYIIEVNPRSSRTVPYISKVTGIPIVPLATQVICGHTLKELGYEPGLQKKADYIAIKMPVFSFEKIRGADISLGPEMKSTGECLGIANTFNEALYKAFEGAGLKLPKHKNMIITVRDSEKENVVPIAKRFQNVGYKIFATRGTAKFLNENGVKALTVRKLEQESPNIMDLILGHEIDLVIDIPQQGAERSRDGFVIRRNAIETGVHVLTSLDTAGALATSLENRAKELTLIDIAQVKSVTYNAIERVEKFLKDADTYYLATAEGDQPRVRPFGTAHIFEGKLYIQTGKMKDVSKQLHANPKAEICAFKDGEWIRVAGELVADDRREARASMLDAYPSLRKMYSEDDGNTEVFYFKNATATISAFTHEPKVIQF